jgi:hypothetical protein
MSCIVVYCRVCVVCVLCIGPTPTVLILCCHRICSPVLICSPAEPVAAEPAAAESAVEAASAAGAAAGTEGATKDAAVSPILA